jgi:hypothetical protein
LSASGIVRVEQRGLLLLAAPDGVVPDLPEQERLTLREQERASEVGTHRLAVAEVDVERLEVEELQLQELGRRVVRVGDEPARVLLFRGEVEAVEQPANLGWNLVVDLPADDLVPLHLAQLPDQFCA